jgi:hypothetical protein
MARHVVTWIETARAAGYGGPDWLPSDADISKSALLERLRSGKAPLAEPPPLGMSCPWYALVEDAGPHYVFDVWRGGAGMIVKENVIVVLQTPFDIVEELGKDDYIVRDLTKNTSYRFHLWFDKEWKRPSGQLARFDPGGWMIQNMTLGKTLAADEANSTVT